MELLNDLIAIGFTEYEAKVYLALLRESPASGYLLGKSAGIPRSMVYEALGRLHVRGAILRSEEQRTTLYRPIPPAVLLDRYEQEQRRLFQELRDRLGALYNAPEEERLWSISGRKAVLSYASQMLQQAQTELLLVLADPELEALRPAILAACERGLLVNTLLTGQGELTCGRVTRHPPLESQLQKLVDILVVVADQRETLIASTDLETSATITNNRHLVLIARQFIWMELFTQRIYTQLGPDLLAKLAAEDRQTFESFFPKPGSRDEPGREHSR